VLPSGVAFSCSSLNVSDPRSWSSRFSGPFSEGFSLPCFKRMHCLLPSCYLRREAIPACSRDPSLEKKLGRVVLEGFPFGRPSSSGSPPFFPNSMPEAALSGRPYKPPQRLPSPGRELFFCHSLPPLLLLERQPLRPPPNSFIYYYLTGMHNFALPPLDPRQYLFFSPTSSASVRAPRGIFFFETPLPAYSEKDVPPFSSPVGLLSLL